ncbi:hypothetical protein FS749_001458 [Ceratobasidium sp. UAMH 11750]|nr:hypothetical protein FS749_001458 [Ceratobasidium sp. UAMH 11750]
MGRHLRNDADDKASGRKHVAFGQCSPFSFFPAPAPRTLRPKALLVGISYGDLSLHDGSEVCDDETPPASRPLRTPVWSTYDMRALNRSRHGANVAKGTGNRKIRKLGAHGIAGHVSESDTFANHLGKLALLHSGERNKYRMPSRTFKIEPSFNVVPPATAANYNIASANPRVTPIAGGRFFDVWRGSLPSGESVAVKCLRNFSLEADAAIEKSVAREIYAWSTLRHNNVLETLGLALFQDQVATVSPWMENGTVLNYIHKQPQVGRWELCHQVAEGLAYLHSRGTVHGDLKAHNVLISGNGVAKITDFGLSTLTKGVGLATSFDGGSVRWMAPELITREGGGPAESMSGDIYALGMTCLEIITGQQPFEGYHLNPLVSLAVLEGKHPERPDQVSKGTKFGDERWSVMLACWDMKPQLRPLSGDVKDMIGRLK